MMSRPFSTLRTRKIRKKIFPPKRMFSFQMLKGDLSKERENKKELFYLRHNKITLWPQILQFLI